MQSIVFGLAVIITFSDLGTGFQYLQTTDGALFFTLSCIAFG
jgi:hypothetical protein